MTGLQVQKHIEVDAGQPIAATGRRGRGGDAAGRAARRINWVRLLHTWHWMSSALCLVGLMLFAATGITLNNADLFEAAEPSLERRTIELPPRIRDSIAIAAKGASTRLPSDAEVWIEDALRVKPQNGTLEWRDEELTIAMPRPGGGSWLRFDLKSGKVEAERKDRGWVAYLNDLHKGRHAGPTWGWFLDVFAGAALISALTGLFILIRQSATRRMVWPLAASGFIIPAVLALIFIH